MRKHILVQVAYNINRNITKMLQKIDKCVKK